MSAGEIRESLPIPVSTVESLIVEGYENGPFVETLRTGDSFIWTTFAGTSTWRIDRMISSPAGNVVHAVCTEDGMSETLKGFPIVVPKDTRVTLSPTTVGAMVHQQRLAEARRTQSLQGESV